MSRLTRDGTAEPASRDQILRHEQRGQEEIHFSCSADHVQDWQPYPVDPYSCYMCDHTTVPRQKGESQTNRTKQMLPQGRRGEEEQWNKGTRRTGEEEQEEVGEGGETPGNLPNHYIYEHMSISRPCGYKT